EWNIEGRRRDGAPGVYVNGAKVAALGIRVRRGCCFHGLAFNIAMDLEPFHRINPCGYAGLEVVAMDDLGGPGSLEAVKPVLLAALGEALGLRLVPADATMAAGARPFRSPPWSRGRARSPPTRLRARRWSSPTRRCCASRPGSGSGSPPATRCRSSRRSCARTAW